MSTIYKAIENLPEHLITNEIAQAAIEEGNINLLNTLPHKFINSEVVMLLINKNAESDRYENFNLKNLPLELRSKEVCEFAIKKSDSNILHTPPEHISVDMLSEMIKNVEKNLKYLHLFPEQLWNIEHIIKGINSIYSYTTPSNRYGYDRHTDLKRVAIFLSYVPHKLKNKAFYKSLFDTKLSVKDLYELTPARFKDAEFHARLFNSELPVADIHKLIPDTHKNKTYYLKIAHKNFDLIPKSFYDYDIVFIGLKNRDIRLWKTELPEYRNSLQDRYEMEEHNLRRELALPFIDNKMADDIISVNPTLFQYLPTKFQTPKRLIQAINKTDRDEIIGLEGNEKLFTEEVCKAYIYRNSRLPKLPKTIWNAEFVDCCMTYGTNFHWLDQIPLELQTLEIAEKAINDSRCNARHIRPDLISLEQAHRLYRPTDRWSSSYAEYVPKHYFKDFCNETGLSEEFFGGELSYAEFRAQRKQYTYCRIGHSFIAYDDKSTYQYKDYRIILTRRTPSSFKPVPIFERSLQTFHSTWLEKLIADNDPSFTKPTISKALKPYAMNGYFSLKKVATVDGADIYANNILGGTAYYTALIGDERIESSSLEDIKDKLTPIEEEEVKDETIAYTKEVVA